MDRASTVIASALLLLLPVMGQAQQNGRKPPRNDAAPKKLYCWNEGGERICSDALPANAVNNAREEFSAETGLRRGQVGAALDADGRAAAAAAAAQQRLDEMAQQTRQRTEQAMLLNYADEAALRAVFAERAAILDNNIATARYNVASLREGLVTMPMKPRCAPCSPSARQSWTTTSPPPATTWPACAKGWSLPWPVRPNVNCPRPRSATSRCR